MCYSRVSTARARLAHLYEHRKTFNKYTIYAHNGGSFDFVLLLDKEHGLLNKENTLWKIDTTKNAPIEQNGRWTTVTLNSVKDEDGKSYSIILRDSNAILPGKLEKLTNEYNVKHKKLPETVDHGIAKMYLCIFYKFNIAGC